MDNRDLYRRAAEATVPIESREVGERRKELDQAFRHRVTEVLDLAESSGYEIEKVEVVQQVYPDSMVGAVTIVKRMLVITTPAGAEFRFLAAPECDDVLDGRLPEVEKQIVIGVHDVFWHGSDGEIAQSTYASSCDIITALSVVDPDTDELIQPHAFSDVTALERLNAQYPVFTLNPQFERGTAEQRLHTPMDISSKMEFEAEQRWQTAGFDHCIQGMICTLDEVEEAIKAAQA